jgi:hypothetical protein
MRRRARDVVGSLRRGGACARDQQRQHAARTGNELPGRHHHSRRQQCRGQQLLRRVVLGDLERTERLRRRQEFRSRPRRAARRGRPTAAWRRDTTTATWRRGAATASRRTWRSPAARRHRPSALSSRRAAASSGLSASATRLLRAAAWLLRAVLLRPLRVSPVLLRLRLLAPALVVVAANEASWLPPGGRPRARYVLLTEVGLTRSSFIRHDTARGIPLTPNVGRE